MIPDDREKIFASIRRGLRTSKVSNTGVASASPAREISDDLSGRKLDEFKSELTKLGGEVFIADNSNTALNYLLSKFGHDNRLFIHEDVTKYYRDVVERIREKAEVKIESDFLKGYDVREASVFDMVISTCAACVAETGTIVLSNKMRLPAALAQTLVVIVDPVQLLDTLDDLFTIKFSEHTGSNLFLVTGPSRTADIEKELVTGVHGPKHVIVIFQKR